MYEDVLKFVCLIDQGSFTLASKELHISQPALSVAIKNLEKNLKTDLIIRSHKSFKISEAGRLVYKYGVSAKNSTELLKLDLITVKNKPINLKIGLIDSVAETLFLESQSFFKQIDELSTLNLTINNSDNLLNRFNKSELDIICITKPVYSISNKKYIGSVREPFYLVCSAKSYEHYSLSLSKYNLIDNFLSYNANSNTANLIDNFLTKNNVTVNKSFYSTSPAFILQLILKDMGASFLPRQMVDNYIKSGELKIISVSKNDQLYRPIDVLSVDSKNIRNVARLILSELQKNFR